MKILAVSDFDNGFPKGLAKKLKKENPDIILTAGDLCYGSKIRKIMFSLHNSDVEWYDAIGRRKAAKLLLDSAKYGDKVLKFLNSLDAPVFLVVGNNDRTGANRKKKGWKFNQKDLFTPLLKKYKNIIPIDLGGAKFEGFYLIGYGQSNSSPELPMYKFQKKELTKKQLAKKLKNFKRCIKTLDKFFKKADPKKTIFLVHNVPFKTKLDKITNKKAPKFVQGKHFGSLVARKIIEKYKPLLCVGGHMHEGFGVDKIGKTLCVNNGATFESHYAIIDIKNNKIKVKLR
jgi:Icc-related predicted phosphoesterase